MDVKTLDKWAERIYSETDVGRSVGTSVAGIVGLAAYLATDDPVIAVFAAVIAFPAIRLGATGIHARAARRARQRVEGEEAERLYGRLSDDEKKVVQAFVEAGGSVLTWGQVNNLGLPAAGIESLIQREVLWTSMTADGMRETFVLDTDLFDVAQPSANL